MEFELQHSVLTCFEPVLNTTVCQEETQEAIVPDSFPDILRILDAKAYACLTGKQVRENFVTVTGLIHTSVLYLPETGEGVQHIELSTPFSCQADANGLSSHGSLLAFPAVRWAEARVLNPRKVLLRLDLAVELWGFQPHEYKLCCGVAQDSSASVHQRFSEETMDIVYSVLEKPFVLSDSIDLGAPMHSHGTLLNLHACAYCSECRLIGSKLIFKGSVELDALLCVGDELKTTHQSLPYSQILEIPGAGEHTSCEVRIALTDLTFQPDSGHSDSGMLSAELLAQAIVREHRCVTVLKDLYSTACHMQVHTQDHPMLRALTQENRTVSLRELAETPVMVQTVTHCWADVGELRVTREGEQLNLCAEIQVNLIYLDDGGQAQSLHKLIPASAVLEATAGSISQCWCSNPKELYAAPTAGGIEVRFSVELHCTTAQPCHVTAVSEAQLGEIRASSDEIQPSIILRLSAPGESLWDLAKCYATTEEDILQANNLEDGILPVGQMLLIPRRR